MGCGASAPKPPEASQAPSDAPKPPPGSSAPSSFKVPKADEKPKSEVDNGDAAKGSDAKGGYQAEAPPKPAEAALEVPAGPADVPDKVPAVAADAAPPPPPKPCLHYYPFAGRGELCRLIAAAGGLELDEKIEKENIHLFGSPGGWPCLEHDSLRISQSFAIESYVARIAPVFSDLTPLQRAEDSMFCKIKEDMIAGYIGIVSSMIADPSQKSSGSEDIAAHSEKWMPLVVSRLPQNGFVNGLAFPTAADLVVVNIVRAFMPFGAAYMLGSYDLKQKFPKIAAHANRVAAHPAVRDYLNRSKTIHYDPASLREASFKVGDAVEVRDHSHSSADWKLGVVSSLEPLRVKVDGMSFSSSWDEVRLRG